MASGVEGAREFAAMLKVAGDLAEVEAEKVVKKGAVEIKKTLVKEASASRHFSAVGGQISFDMTFDGGVIAAEIGPNKVGAGKLGNIAYFGGTGWGGKWSGGTLPDPQLALEAEVPALELHLAEVVMRSLQ